MANLEDLGKKLGVDIKPSNKKIGKKRRSWLTSEQKKESTNGLQLGDKESTNGLQLGDKESTNGLQLGDKESTNGLQLGDKESTNGLQLGDKESTNGLQLGDKESTNGLQLGDKESTNGLQLGDKESTNGLQLGDKESTNGLQLGDKESTNGLQLGDKESTNGLQLGDKESTNGLQLGDKESTNGLQLGDKESTNKTDISEFESLTGIQKRIIEYMYQSCTGRSRITSKINIIELQESLKLGESTTKTSILRLKKKNYIAIANRKNGRGGWCQYELKKSIFNDASKLLQNNSLKETDNHSYIYNNSNSITTNINKCKIQSDSFQPDDADKDKIIADLQKQLELQKQQFNNQSQSTSSPSEQDRLTDHINKRLNDIETQANTENAADSQDDSEAWANIDFSALTDYGFKKSHIKQIINAKTSLTPQEVQESIEHYAWALNHRAEEMQNYAPSHNRLRGIMGVLKKGSPWIEAQYRSPEDLAIEAQIKAKQAQLERKKAQKEALLTTEFNLWYANLTADDLAKIEEEGELAKQMPPTAFRTKGDNAHYVKALKRYFKQHI